MTNLWNDLRYALRQLRKSPGFTLTVVLTLALGIGATAAMFSVLDAVLLHPLPYNGVDRIVRVKTTAAAGFTNPESWQEYRDMRRLNHTFSVLAGMDTDAGVTMKLGNRAVYLHAVRGTDNFFSLYGVRPILGRTYLPGEDQNGKNGVAVLSYAIWRQYFGGRKNAVGRVVDLNGSPYTVIGVMPAGFRVRFDARNVIYTPLQLSAEEIKSRGSYWLPVWGRLKPGVTVAQASADMNHVLKELGKQFPIYDNGKTAEIIPVSNTLLTNDSGDSERPELWLLLGAVFAVLLIACANVAGLLLARGMLREREMGVRAALGAGRERLAAQMLTESVLLGMGGGLCGLAIAGLLLTGMQQFLEKAFQRGGTVHLNFPVLGATFAISLLASVAAGLAPAWRAARIDPNSALKSGGSAGISRHQHRLRASFVVTQVALSLMLLVCSGLLLLALRSKLQTSLGFNPKNLLTLEVDIPTGDYKGLGFVQQLVQPLEARVRSIPGVMAVGSNNMLPIFQTGSNGDLAIMGKPVDPINKARLTEIRFTTPGYFAAMQLPILEGRDFTAQDTAKSQPVAIVNQAWVQKFLNKNEDPLAQAFKGDTKQSNIAIVGVAHSGQQDIFASPSPEADFPMTQMPEYYLAFVPQFYLFVRTGLPPTSIIPQLREALHDVAPNVAFRTPETMENVLSDALVTNRMLSWLFGLFAAVAALLTAIGIYGLLSQEVASRTRDIGVRMALGATRLGVGRLVMRRVGILLAIGLGTGLAGVYLVRRALAAIMVVQFHRNAWSIAAVAGVLAAIGLMAALLPARRAASIDPMRALRSE